MARSERRALGGNSAMLKIDPANPPNEFPDIVGLSRRTRSSPASVRSFRRRARLRELTPLPLIIGTLLGMVFGASSLYLVLKVGLTVSASIPGRGHLDHDLSPSFQIRSARFDILENNIVQTAGSAGESIAFGLGVTMPAIMILGFDLEITRVMLVAILGGLIGILMMIPLRRALIVQQHGYLKYPEGTACAEVLKAAASLNPAMPRMPAMRLRAPRRTKRSAAARSSSAVSRSASSTTAFSKSSKS
jgi:uncharacterized oligopeptide transporter (OPT) family protein